MSSVWRSAPVFQNQFAVRGTTFRKEQIAQINVGDPVCLEPEPTNPYDSNAIQVLVIRGNEQIHIGYVPRELCGEIMALLEGNHDGIWNTAVASVDGARVFVSFESGRLVGRQKSVWRGD